MAHASVSPIARMIGRLTEDQRNKNLPDKDLLLRFSGSQDQAAFAGLLRRHGAMVLDVCRSVAGNEADAEDAFQATFLVLARSAKAIRKLASVGSWLHGVAFRTALNGRKELARRRKLESCAPRPTDRASAQDLPWSEVQELLHAELTALSERYRAPLVLCFLEGRTQDEAAKQLNISKSTLRQRLERARSLLRARLVRHGLGTATILTAAAWPAAKASACVAPKLATATVKAATALAGGQSIAGLVSGPVSLLVASALRITVATKLKIATAVMLVLALVPAVGSWAVRTHLARKVAGLESRHQPAKAGTPASQGAKGSGDQASPAPEPRKKQTISGRVLDAAGKPASGAKLFLLNSGGLLAEAGAADGDGRFAVDVAQPETPSKRWGWLAAKVPGFGVDFVALDGRDWTKEVELRLPADQPIQGRVLDLQGKPVAGALVRLYGLTVYGADTVEPYLAALLKRADLTSPGATLTKGVFGGPQALVFATTDKEGRFQLNGAGTERHVRLRITGPGIAQTFAEVITRTGFNPEPYNAVTGALRPKDGQRVPGQMEATMLLGPNPTVVAHAEQLVRGVITEADTGKPLAGARIVMNQDKMSWDQVLITTTDKDGRYEIRGGVNAPRYTLTVEPDAATGMVRRTVTIPDSKTYKPIVANIKLARGVVITGRLTDRVTGKPLPGHVGVSQLFDNPHAGKAEYTSENGYTREFTKLDGTFRIVGIPGRVLLMAGVDESRLPGGLLEALRYRLPIADPQFPKYFSYQGPYLTYRSTRQGYGAVNGNYCKVLDTRPGTTEVQADVVLDRAPAIAVSLRDRAGRPVAGTWLEGLTSQRYLEPFWHESADIEVYGVDKEKPRLVTFFDPKNNLSATLTLKGDEKQPLQVTLGPPGVVEGRLLNPDGTPATGVTVAALYADYGMQTVFKKMTQEPHGYVMTDKKGLFRFERMIPGHAFTLSYSPPSKQGLFREPRRTFVGREFGPVDAGATIDTGGLTLTAEVAEDN